MNLRIGTTFRFSPPKRNILFRFLFADKERKVLYLFNHFVYTIRDNCPPSQKVVQQPQPQHPAPPLFSPILPRSVDGFSPRQHSTSVQQPQQQQQQQQPKSIGSHHYRSVPPAEPQYHQQRHADGSQSWNEWNQQLLVRFLPVVVCSFFVLSLLPSL